MHSRTAPHFWTSHLDGPSSNGLAELPPSTQAPSMMQSTVLSGADAAVPAVPASNEAFKQMLHIAVVAVIVYIALQQLSKFKKT